MLLQAQRVLHISASFIRYSEVCKISKMIDSIMMMSLTIIRPGRLAALQLNTYNA